MAKPGTTNFGGVNLEAIRQRLASSSGPRYWRSLEEVAATPEFRALVENEFPAGATEWEDDPSRRAFLQLMAASLAFGGLTACRNRQPEEKIVPYVEQPELLVPGKPVYYATSFPFMGYARGVLVESHQGRPIKIEGNPDHPASLGATDAITQASILNLYDPDRAKAVRGGGAIRRWEHFTTELEATMSRLRERGGAGLRILTETTTSPTFAWQLRRLLAELPEARWHRWDAVGRDNAWAGARMAFGEAMDCVYRFDAADVIVSLDADFLLTDPGSVRYARDFIDRRRVREGTRAMNRLYVVESAYTITGARADNRLPLKASRVEGFARALAVRLGVDLPRTRSAEADTGGDTRARWIEAVAGDLEAARGHSLILAGDHQPPLVHAIAHALNAALGNAGRTVQYIAPVAAHTEPVVDSLRSLLDDMAAGRVELLLAIGANPAYTAPPDFDVPAAFANVAMSVRLAPHEDETSRLCHWHVPEAHYLETWSDLQAFDGTAGIVQPLIAPLYFAKSAHEMIEALRGNPNVSGYDIVRDHWRETLAPPTPEEFERAWRRALHDGVMASTATASVPVDLRPASEWVDAGEAAATLPVDAAAGGLEIVFRPDPSVWDGRHANNGWLQELPKPLTKLTWDNAALVSPATAQRLGVVNDQIVVLRAGDRAIEAAIWLLPGMPDDTVTLHLGYGRTSAGHVGDRRGFNAYALRTSDALGFRSDLRLETTERVYPLACTQDHHTMAGRDIVRSGSLASFLHNPSLEPEHSHAISLPLLAHKQYDDRGEKPEATLFQNVPNQDNTYAWGMSIDLTACIGCNACVVACQAENNIPIVGKSEVLNGREMHWLRLDRYFEGDALHNPRAHHQPMLCMHCEFAPCELVCPVAATTHSDEGLNEMTYNRCVGTRYCSNNCPYKVRRFNFLQYAEDHPTVNMQRNPDVTVRARGVMEKCTYCVQRISAARIEAKKDGRTIADGEIRTACQQVCPTRAIVFGNILDRSSQVSALKAQPHDYGLLTELNTRPRTTYLAHVTNPHPDLEPTAAGTGRDNDHGGSASEPDDPHEAEHATGGGRGHGG